MTPPAPGERLGLFRWCGRHEIERRALSFVFFVAAARFSDLLALTSIRQPASGLPKSAVLSSWRHGIRAYLPSMS